MLLLALVGLAFATRVQAVALAPAVLLAPLVLAVFERRGVARDDLAVPLAVRDRGRGSPSRVLVVQLASRQELLGAYSPVGERTYDVGEALRYLWWHVAELSLYVLVIPLAATIVLVARARSLDARLQAFLAATVSLTVCIVPVVATFASEFSDRIEERNMFYVAPLFCIALLAWVERGAPRPRLLAAAAAVVSALLVVAIPFERFLTTSAITDTLMLLPFWSLQDRIGADWIGARRARRSRPRSPRRSSSCRGATRSRCRCSSSASGSSRSGRSGGGRTASSGSRAERSSRASARPTATGSIGRCRRESARRSSGPGARTG